MLLRALDALAASPGISLRAVSNLYLSRPVGPQSQPPFFNAAAALNVALGDDPIASALELLSICKSLEQILGRQPRERWGPREIDLDILVFGRHQISLGRPSMATDDGPGQRPAAAPSSQAGSPRWLVVPHPEARRRLFVLAPLMDLAPRLVPPGWRETVATVYARLAAVDPAAVARIGRWTGAGWQIEARSGD